MPRTTCSRCRSQGLHRGALGARRAYPRAGASARRRPCVRPRRPRAGVDHARQRCTPCRHATWAGCSRSPPPDRRQQAVSPSPSAGHRRQHGRDGGARADAAAVATVAAPAPRCSRSSRASASTRRGSAASICSFTLTIDGLICQGPVAARAASPETSGSCWPRSTSASTPARQTHFARAVRALHRRARTGGRRRLRVVVGTHARTVTRGGRARGRAGRRGGRRLFVSLQRPRRATGAATVHALPAFDEYYISYADRTIVCAPEHLATVGPGKNGMVRATIVEQDASSDAGRTRARPATRRRSCSWNPPNRQPWRPRWRDSRTSPATERVAGEEAVTATERAAGEAAAATHSRDDRGSCRPRLSSTPGNAPRGRGENMCVCTRALARPCRSSVR